LLPRYHQQIKPTAEVPHPLEHTRNSAAPCANPVRCAAPLKLPLILLLKRQRRIEIVKNRSN
jgi:hypothetical protein